MLTASSSRAPQAEHFPNHQERYRARYRTLKSGWQDSLSLYIEIVDRYVGAGTAVLDIGCGHGDFLREVYARTPHTYGIDPDAPALAKNSIIRHLVVGNAETLPFPDAFFDLVVSAWVLEHLERPAQVFREVYRVLKPGGHFIFLTPNSWNYNVWLIRLIPNRFHELLTRRLYRRQANDTYQVYYRSNSPRKITRLLRASGFSRGELILNGDPSYISFNDVLFACACLLEALLDWKPLQLARVHIIGIYEK
jgi:ubiquinone/menaquinone biosynthesis C-methylase UbiE